MIFVEFIVIEAICIHAPAAKIAIMVIFVCTQLAKIAFAVNSVDTPVGKVATFSINQDGCSLVVA